MIPDLTIYFRGVKSIGKDKYVGEYNDYQLYKIIIGISSGVKSYVELKFVLTIMQKVGGRVKRASCSKVLSLIGK